MFDEHFFKKLTVSPEKECRAALLALEIFSVLTGNLPIAFSVMAIHTLMFAYENSPNFMKTSDEVDSKSLTAHP